MTCALNMQHNCQAGGCTVTHTRTYSVERTQVQNKRPEVTHNPSNSFILNAAAQYNSEYHRLLTNHTWSEVPPEQWHNSIEEGLSVWFTRCPPKEVGEEAITEPLQEVNLDVFHMAL